ncbi:hypothetical protein D9M68_627830 [compost metagenome]
MKNRLFISTNWDKLDEILEDRQQRGLPTIKNSCFVGFNHADGIFEAALVSDLILILDTATKETLQEKGLTFNSSTDYFLHHTTENALVKVQDELFFKCEQGLHEIQGKYKMVFDVIMDEASYKTERIIHLLFNPLKIEDKMGAEIEITIQDAQSAYRNLYRTFTYDYIKYKKNGGGKPMDNIGNELHMIWQYYESKGTDVEVKRNIKTLFVETSFETFYSLLQQIHPSIEKFLFR